MRRIKLTVAYDGTNYVGYQIQPNGISIEEVLTKELRKLLKEDITVIGASRTDSGVHACGNVVVFDTNARMPADKFKFALNIGLPEDIVVQESVEVAPDYHPRRVNCIKTYEYRILNRKIPDPNVRLNSLFYYYDLDIERMQEAAKCLIGKHDFKSFCSIKASVKTTVRKITDINITKKGDMISIRIQGTGFLYNMVRIIVGTLLKIGTGLWPVSKMQEALDACDRAAAGPTAPAKGLTLISIVETGGLKDDEPEDEEEE